MCKLNSMGPSLIHRLLIGMTVMVACLLLSHYIARQVIIYRLYQQAADVEAIFIHEMTAAEQKLKSVSAVLNSIEATACDNRVVEALEQHMLNSNNQSVTWVQFTTDKEKICSVAGITGRPHPNYYYLAGQSGGKIDLYQLRDNLNLEAELPLYASKKTKDYSLYIAWDAAIELAHLLSTKYCRTQVSVRFGSDDLLFNLAPAEVQGEKIEVYSAETGLTFQLIKEQSVLTTIQIITFWSLLVFSLLASKMWTYAFPIIKSRVWNYHFARAFKSNEFYLVYQPIYDLQQHKPIGVEVLLRWCDSRGHPRDTADFIGQLEQAPIMPLVTRWVIETAFAALATMIDKGQLQWFSVNISAKDIEQGALLEYLVNLEKQGFPLGYLSLELTERIPVTQWHVLQHFIHTCRRMGCKVKLDDAGTGYGGSLYIQELEFDYLKIDREFVRRLGTPDSNTALIQSYKSIADQMGIEVIAEGVNDAQQAEALYQMGITAQQGWLYAKGLSKQELGQYLNATSLGC